VCWSAPVRQRFRDAVWVTLGEAPAQVDLLAKIDSVAHALTGQHVDTGDVEQAGLRLGQVLDDRPEVLLVIDDVWRAADLRSFLQGGARVHPVDHHPPAAAAARPGGEAFGQGRPTQPHPGARGVGRGRR
jgi:hypothetical protein